MLQDFESVSDHFGTLCIKELTSIYAANVLTHNISIVDRMFDIGYHEFWANRSHYLFFHF